MFCVLILFAYTSSVSDQLTTIEESDPQTEADDESASGIASLHLNQMKVRGGFGGVR